MATKIGVSKSEMLRMREQGLSNRDIANCLGIHFATVYNYIGPQGGRMESLAAFDEPKPKTAEIPKEEPKPVPKAVDNLKSVYEIFASTDGEFRAEVDWENECVSIFDAVFTFEQLGTLAMFVVGLATKIEKSIKK
jgi:predicted transcriptional regulator